jgi:hypothetical protein
MPTIPNESIPVLEQPQDYAISAITLGGTAFRRPPSVPGEPDVTVLPGFVRVGVAFGKDTDRLDPVTETTLMDVWEEIPPVDAIAMPAERLFAELQGKIGVGPGRLSVEEFTQLYTAMIAVNAQLRDVAYSLLNACLKTGIVAFPAVARVEKP